MEGQETNDNCINEKIDNEMNDILSKYPQDKDNLIKVLEDTQQHFGYIPTRAQQDVAEYLKMSLADVYGVITFYSRFTTKPKGKYNISICLGTACFVKGSQEILDRAKARLNIEEGEMTPDGKFSIDTVRCVGACGLAPVFMVNGEVYGRATVKKFDEVIDEYMNKE